MTGSRAGETILWKYFFKKNLLTHVFSHRWPWYSSIGFLCWRSREIYRFFTFTFQERCKVNQGGRHPWNPEINWSGRLVSIRDGVWCWRETGAPEEVKDQYNATNTKGLFVEVDPVYILLTAAWPPAPPLRVTVVDGEDTCLRIISAQPCFCLAAEVIVL